MQQPAIVVEGLAKSFGETRALDGIDFEVPEGAVLGLLGPNGAGKTTAIRILATLIPLDAGRASVGGYDVVRQPGEVRRLIGLTGQYAAVDELISGRENLFMIGRLIGFGKVEARQRSDELLEFFGLTDAATKIVKTYSGGMRRRLDLAASLVGRPRFLYLDEPTTGLDPHSRRQVWDEVQQLAAQGTTVLLTTQYLDEADHLADEIVVIDRGRVIAAGTADELKQKVGGQVIEVRPGDVEDLGGAARVLEKLARTEAAIDRDEGLVSVQVADPSLLTAAVRRLDRAGIPVVDLALRRPSLDDVFLALTGRHAESEQADDENQTERSAR
jgi:oleandomycin transport system ATP-binding protein